MTAAMRRRSGTISYCGRLSALTKDARWIDARRTPGRQPPGHGADNGERECRANQRHGIARFDSVQERRDEL